MIGWYHIGSKTFRGRWEWFGFGICWVRAKKLRICYKNDWMLGRYHIKSQAFDFRGKLEGLVLACKVRTKKS